MDREQMARTLDHDAASFVGSRHDIKGNKDADKKASFYQT